MSRTRTSRIGKPKYTGGKAFRSQPYTKNYKQQMNAENEDTSLTQGKTTPTGRPIPND